MLLDAKEGSIWWMSQLDLHEECVLLCVFQAISSLADGSNENQKPPCIMGYSHKVSVPQ